jgi:4a-hydroxytetrahydrobiopterin dehydratase
MVRKLAGEVFSVTRRPPSGIYPCVTILNSAQIKAALATLPDWKKQGGTISRTFQFKDFPAAIKFVNAVARLAEQAWHHPDIDVRWNKVTLTLTTHDAGGLTDKDFNLARQFNQQG